MLLVSKLAKCQIKIISENICRKQKKRHLILFRSKNIKLIRNLVRNPRHMIKINNAHFLLSICNYT
ncbi:unnamed protein product [Meloidogyne enterolobii]|uniref:Uncharacterized protein n=1 Tax=Meloidogyne enterolobii TaxID=390850 RepID=A0ACB1AFT6_MELEN